MTVTISLFNGSTWDAISEDLVLDVQFSDGGTSKLNSITVTFSTAALALANPPAYSKQIKMNDDGVDVFTGTIDHPTSEYPVFICECYSYGQQFLDRYVNEIFTSVTPEYIAQYLITNYTSMTYAGTWVTGVTIPRIVFKEKRLVECLNILMQTLDGYFYADTNKNFYIAPRASLSTGQVLTVGGNVLTKPTWEKNPDFIVTNLTVKGDYQSFNIPEPFTSTASQTVFTLSSTPIAGVIVTVAGVRKVPFINGTGDYVLDPDNRTVTFTVGLSAGLAVVITYDYQLPVKVTILSDVYDSYGSLIQKDYTYETKAIKTFADARSFARKFLTLHSQPSQSATLTMNGLDSNLKSGQLVTVVDSDESPAINGTFVILSVEYQYPDDSSYIKIGTVEQLYFNWNKEVIQRIQDLQQQNADSEKLQLYGLFGEKINLAFGLTYQTRTRRLEDSFILGHQTLGRMRASLNVEADCADAGNHGTWNGSSIGGSQFSTSGYRLSCGSFNGSDNYISSSASLASIQSVVVILKPSSFNKDCIQLASGKSISINSSGVITTTGLSGVSVYVNNVATTQLILSVWNVVYIEFSAITVNALQVGKVSTYYAGQMDEFILFNTTLGANDRTDIANNNFYTNHAHWVNCKLWYSFDNPKLGDRRAAAVVVENG